jgi:tetratricopeptide (TPR) repeat protein
VNNLPKRPIGIGLVLLALLLSNGLQGSIDRYRHYPAPECPLEKAHKHGPKVKGCEKWGEGYGPRMDWIQAMQRLQKMEGEDLSMEAFSVVIVGGLMGGFRQVATSILWMKSDQYWHEGKADRFIPILRAVTWLDPNFIDGWRIAGWHWAYNLYAQAGDKWPEKQKCLRNGLKFLKEGIVWNPNSSELCFETGWTYYDKGGELREAVKWFRDARAKKDYKQNYKVDIAQRMIGHALERIPDLDAALDNYRKMLRLKPHEEEALEKWIEFKKRYRKTKRMVKAWGALHPVLPPRQPIPGMPEEMKQNMPPPVLPEIPKGGTNYFNECNHLKRPRWTKEGILREMPFIEKWKYWVEFDAVTAAYETAKNKDDSATMALIEEQIPDIKEAMEILPIIRDIETREIPAPGATITIRMRYYDAWKLYKEKKYKEAEEAIMESMELEPEEASFPIGHHLLARIYEGQYKETKDRKDLEKAYYKGWVECARHNQMNRLAHVTVHKYQVEHKMPVLEVKKPKEPVPEDMTIRKGGLGTQRPGD